jgi:hypothetical protein
VQRQKAIKSDQLNLMRARSNELLVKNRDACEAALEQNRFLYETKMMAAEDDAARQSELRLVFTKVQQNFNLLRAAQEKSV